MSKKKDEGPVSQKNWKSSELLSLSETCRQATEASLSQMNSSINWAMTLSLAISGFVIQAILQVNDPSTTSNWITLICLKVLAMAILVNFFFRTAKSYLNVIRFALVDREALKVHFTKKKKPYKKLNDVVKKYYIGWANPLSLTTIFKKVFFDFGFIYWVILNIFLTIFLIFQIENIMFFSTSLVITPIAWIAIIIIEYSVFMSSAYASNNIPHKEAIEKA